jgi:cation transport ATPase
LIPLVFLGGVAMFVVMYAMGREVVEAYSAFSVIIAASVPVTAFFMISLPVVSANRIGAKHSTAFVGNAIAEEYSSASVLSFADTEVYPASLVKITNIRMYGDFRIDAVITDLAKVFSHVGGPLSKVLAATLSGEVEKPALIRVIESANDGLCVTMDGHNYFLGKKSYMRRYRFEAPNDDGDDVYENNVGSIMYVVIDEKLAAKLYIKYTVNPLFDSLLKDMYRAGLCLGVKTLDPNINNELINSAVKFKKCPIAVLRGNDPADVAGEVERVDSGVVCNSTLHNFLKMFALCDKTRHITKCNVAVSIISVALSFVAVAFLAVTGGLAGLDSIHAVAFQMFWLLPVWLISFLMMKK